MSFPHFGHPYGSASQFLVSASSSATCCESSPCSVADVASGSTQAAALCLAPYDSRLLGSARPELGAALGIYGAPYAAAAAAQSYPGYLPYSPEPPALYGALNAQYEFKETAGNFTPGLSQPGAYCPYEPTLGQYQYDRYGAMELSGAGRRKNATRETTSTLKAWLNEHRKNPYPTKGEKIMLAIITKMTLTQVSTWFANARRRLKKENKMTWAPKNKGGEERRAGSGAEESQGCLNGDTKEVAASQEAQGLRLSDLEDLEEEEEEEEEEVAEEEEAVVIATDRLAEFHKDVQSLPGQCAAGRVGRLERRDCGLAAPRFSFNEPPGSGEADFLRAEPGGPALTVHYPCSQKPRIWSLAHTAAASAVEGAPPTLPKPQSPECHLIPGQPPGLGGRRTVPRDSACDESSRVAKAFGKPTFALQGPPPNCAQCPRRREPAVQCQYPSGAEGASLPSAKGQPTCSQKETLSHSQKDRTSMHRKVRDPPQGPGDDSQSSRGPWVTPADTGKFRGEAEMQSAEAQHSRDSPYRKNLTATNDIPESPDPASATPALEEVAPTNWESKKNENEEETLARPKMKVSPFSEY